MTAALKITKVGNSAGVILPKELLAHLDAQVGDQLAAVKTPRGIEIRKVDPEFLEQMEVARTVMAKRRASLAALAKS